jgi:FtsZ-binding cell division protein ZapB
VRSTLWVPEARVRLVSKSINDNCDLVHTRGVKRRLSLEREKNETLNKKYKELELDSEVLEEEIARLGRENSKLKAKTLDVTSRRDALVLELRGTTAESIFSKEVPEGRNAKEIQSRIARDIEKPLQSEIAVLQSKIAASKKKERALKIENQELTSRNSQLKRENNERRAEIKSMLGIVDDSRIFAEVKKDEDNFSPSTFIIFRL